MSDFTNEELADMHLMFGEAEGNITEALQLYVERFPHRRHPTRRMFIAVHLRLKETGKLQSFQKIEDDSSKYSEEFEREVLDRILTDPSVKIKTIAKIMNVSKTDIWRVVNDEKEEYYPIERVDIREEPNEFEFENECEDVLET